MKLEYAVTLEFSEKPPLTVRGVCTAVKAATVARRAVNEVLRQHPNQHWFNLVILLQRPAGEIPLGVTGQQQIP
jgi:hypothetical protein